MHHLGLYILSNFVHRGKARIKTKEFDDDSYEFTFHNLFG